MSPSDQFLAKVLDGAQKFADGGTLNWWKGTCVDISFPDPLRPERVSIIIQLYQMGLIIPLGSQV
jgi:hypothetical protein